MSFIKNSRGVINPAAIAAIVVVLAVGGFAAWKVFNKKNTSSGSSATTSSIKTDSKAEADCNKEINDKTFCKFVARFDLEASYKATIAATDEKGVTTKLELENDSKNNSLWVTKDDSGKETAAFITLNNSTYIKDESSGTWTKYTSQGTSDTKPTSEANIDTGNITENNTISYKNLGQEACGKLKCYKYQEIDSKNPDTTQYIWFDTKDYLMQRWYVKDKTGSSDMSFSYVNVTIKEPSPVQEYSVPSAGGSSSADVNALMQAAEDAAAAASSDSGADETQ